MKERFEGPGRPLLLDAIKRQDFVRGDDGLANGLAYRGSLAEFAKSAVLVTEDAEDNDVYLILAGSVGIVVKGNQVATRNAGQHIGEMAAMDSAERRSASVIALQTVVALKVSSTDFRALGETFPRIWKPIAQEMSRRLRQRNALIPAPNAAPKLFVISSTEALAIAEEIRAQLEHDVFSQVWTDGVFFAGGYPLEALEDAVAESDFAVAIAQPDDIIEIRGDRQPTLRDNVLFELGLFMGKLTRARALLVHPTIKNLKLPSDLHGLTLIHYETGEPDTLSARLAPACDHIRKIVKNLGVRRFLDELAQKTSG